MRPAIMVLLLLLSVIGARAADPLPPGIHKGLTSEDGKYRFTVIVPKAGEGNQQLPVVFIMPSVLRGLLDPFPWQGLAERRGCYVVALDDGRVRGKGEFINVDNVLPADLAHICASLPVIEQRVNLHPFLRIAVADLWCSRLVAEFAAKQQQDLAGIVFTRPNMSLLIAQRDGIPKHLGMFLLIGEHDEVNRAKFEDLRDSLRTRGLTTRAALVAGGKADDWVPQAGCDVAVDHLLDHALINHPKLSVKQRSAGIDAVLARGQTLLALEDKVCEEQLGFLLSVPGLEVEIKPAYIPLANHWIDIQLQLAKARPDSEIAKAHEDLSVLSKRVQFKRADKDHQKQVLDELKRLRKDKRIKAEVAAADILADTLAALEVDFSTAKQRIALKTLEDLVAKHPGTEAGKAAAKLLEPLRRSLR